MSDYKAPTAGPGDEPPDVVPRTGPPTGSAVRPLDELAVAPEIMAEPVEALAEGSAEAPERAVEEVHEAAVAEQATEPEPSAVDAPSDASPAAEDTAVPKPQPPDLVEHLPSAGEKPPPAVEQIDAVSLDQQPIEFLDQRHALVRDVLIIDPTAVSGPVDTPPIPDFVTAAETPAAIASETEEPPLVPSYEAEQPLAAEPRPPDVETPPVESLSIEAPQSPAEPEIETAVEPEIATEVPPASVEPPAAAPEPDQAAKPVAEAPPSAPALPFPRAIPTPALSAPVFVRPPDAPAFTPRAEAATAAAPEILAPSPQLPPPQLTSAPPPPVATPRTRSPWAGRLRRAALVVVGLAVGYAVLVLALIVAYRWIDPPRSALMLANHLTGEPVLYAPVPINRISSYLQRAVVTSEDARFCYHRGVDWPALYEAMGESRGGSTITMQTAKNLFLWPSRSYIRKAIEIPVAMTIDALWPKRRILEVYLNIAEWGPGIFGAEAAAYYHFDKPASRLTAHEATLLAASLPNPIARDAGDPGRITEILASRLRARLGNSDAFVRCLGLRTMRPAPVQTPRKEPKAPQKAAPKAASTKAESQIPPWRTTTDPAFSPWQN